MTADRIVELAGQYLDGLITDLEFRYGVALTITELSEAETELLAGYIILGWRTVQ